LKNNC
jgi:hypothetical protein